MDTKSFRAQQGQTMAEYAVTLGIVTAAVVAAIALLSTNIGNLIDKIASYVA
jgi:Flp pilus assembly pilin Flp